MHRATHKQHAARCTQVYVAPHQWSFPLNLPVQLFGIFPTGLLEEDGQYPWGDELDLKVFSANLAQGALAKTCFDALRQEQFFRSLLGIRLESAIGLDRTHCVETFAS